MAFFKQDPYNSIESWAKSRGQQIRDHFSIALDTMRPQGTTKVASMSDVEWNTAKVQTLNPKFRSQFLEFLTLVDETAGARGVDLIVWDGTRSLERQVELYGRGRTDKGMIVTKTIASNHLWGCAIDLCTRSPKGQPEFALPPWYKKEILPLAEKFHLESLLLVHGIDPPHIQVPPAAQPPEIRTIAAELKADFQVAWAKFD